MIQQQELMISSSYSDIYDLVVPKDNFLRMLNELVEIIERNSITVDSWGISVTGEIHIEQDVFYKRN
ncbi:hypothetical protein [Bacillus sp. SD088]|uniref:hypothetical protein n=1 Tax=Bacillus sp. SD088 TaxID=2782012 RepID=UPI001A961384|nr:hypothetical protein [Bacillus sp. SD088]MBO0992170.1 hypothetical protein [Bacillus sp. SD088]